MRTIHLTDSCYETHLFPLRIIMDNPLCLRNFQLTNGCFLINSCFFNKIQIRLMPLYYLWLLWFHLYWQHASVQTPSIVSSPFPLRSFRWQWKLSVSKIPSLSWNEMKHPILSASSLLSPAPGITTTKALPPPSPIPEASLSFLKAHTSILFVPH